MIIKEIVELNSKIKSKEEELENLREIKKAKEKEWMLDNKIREGEEVEAEGFIVKKNSRVFIRPDEKELKKLFPNFYKKCLKIKFSKIQYDQAKEKNPDISKIIENKQLEKIKTVNYGLKISKIKED